MKRKASDRGDEGGTTNIGIVKVEEDVADYSQDVRRKLSTASRTGTACDRCRVRKMRCDDRLDGCASCRQAQTECKTTDRITGKATVRGYVENLESRLEKLEQYISGLQDQIQNLGHTPIPRLEPEPSNKADSASAIQESSISRTNSLPKIESSTTLFHNGIDPYDPNDEASQLPTFRKGLSGNNYLGISSGNSLLSSVRGTSMNILGMEIDLADWMCADVDEPEDGQPASYNKSYRAFISTAFGESKMNRVELPRRDVAFDYAGTFFRVTSPFVPVCHQPTFMKLLSRLYDDPDFQPSVADIVLVHAMFAIIYYQYSARGASNVQEKDDMNRISNLHYHYALGFFPQLMASHTLADVQALTLLCVHVRNLPKPGASWMLTSITLNLAVEMGLHRSAKSWAPTTSRKSILEIEMRKRVFWSLVWVHVLTSGSLGRPMALSTKDWDVEMPETVNDNVLTDSFIDTSQPNNCNFLAGIENFKIIPIYMDLYNDFYSVKRSPKSYEKTVKNLELRIQAWIKGWPDALTNEAAAQNELGRVHLQYLYLWQLHIRLLLRHPSLSMSTCQRMNADNLRVCMEVSKEMLEHVKIIRTYRSLDGTWQTGALFILAIATTLYGHWEKRQRITMQELDFLKQDMSDWVSIMVDMEVLLGSGSRLQDTVRATIDCTITILDQHLRNSTARPSQYGKDNILPMHQSRVDMSVSASDSVRTPEAPSYVAMQSQALRPPSTTNTADPRPVPQAAFMSDGIAEQSYAAYGKTSQYIYQDPFHADNNPLRSPMNDYVNTTQQPTGYQPNFTAMTTSYGQDAPEPYHTPGSPSSWHLFTGGIVPSLDPNGTGGPMSSATALMQLSQPPPAATNESRDVSGDTRMNTQPDLNYNNHVSRGGQMWPMMLDNNGGFG